MGSTSEKPCLVFLTPHGANSRVPDDAGLRGVTAARLTSNGIRAVSLPPQDTTTLIGFVRGSMLLRKITVYGVIWEGHVDDSFILDTTELKTDFPFSIEKTEERAQNMKTSIT